MALTPLSSICNQIGGVTVAMYTATTILGALEGLVLGYAARPAWQPKPAESDALPPIRIEPSAVGWDAMSRVSVINSGYVYALPALIVSYANPLILLPWHSFFGQLESFFGPLNTPKQYIK
jgi:hypothetical protein